MALYKNAMEQIVEDAYDLMINQFDCCKCERCRNDIIAYALNQIPPKYVVTATGAAYSKLYSLSAQCNADILAVITRGVEIVKEHPRHDT